MGMFLQTDKTVSYRRQVCKHILVSFGFYQTKFEANLNKEMKTFKTFFLVQKTNIIYSIYDT